MKLPSKRVLSVFILVAALVAAIIIAFGRDKASVAINYASNLVAGEKISVPENPDWQNELSGISIDTEKVPTENTASSTETATDLISKTLMSNYIALKQSNSLDQTSAQELINKTLNYIEKSSGQVTRITQLKVVPDSGKQSIFEYGENLGNILKNNKPREIKNELEIITKAVESRDSTKINELDSVIAIYEKISEELLAMPVPQTFVKAHLDMVNGTTAMALALKEVKIVFNDPIKGLSAIQLYQEGMTIFTQAIKATNFFIIKNNIVYKQGSGGYYLLYGI